MTTKNPHNRFFQKIKGFLNHLPYFIGNTAVNEFKNNFKTESFFGKKWQARSSKYNRNKGRGVLTDTGNLRQSIQVLNHSSKQVVVGTHDNIPYAKIHNEGGILYIPPHKRVSSKNKRFNVKGYSYKLPKRQFMGDHPILRTQIKKEITNKLKTLFK